MAKIESRSLPKIVSSAEWHAARDQLLIKKRKHMQAGDAIAADRRRLPMVKIESPYTFEGEHGKVPFVDLFGGRRQLILYHFMFDPKWEAGCSGCSMLADGIGNLAHLHGRDVSAVLVSRAPLDKLLAFKKRMDRNIPWYSSFETDFNADFGRTQNDEKISGTSVFLRDGADIFRAYFCSNRGDEVYMSTWKLLDLVPFGRQEL